MGQRRPAHQPRVLRGPRSGVLAGDNAGLYPRRQRVRGSLSSALTAKTSLEERALAEPTGVLRRAPPQGGAAGRPPAGCGSDHRPCRGRQRLPGSAGACRCSGHALSPPRRQSWSGRDRTAAPRGRTCGPRLTRPKGTATAGPRPPAEEGAGGRSGKEGGDQKESQARHRHKHRSRYGQRQRPADTHGHASRHGGPHGAASPALPPPRRGATVLRRPRHWEPRPLSAPSGGRARLRRAGARPGSSRRRPASCRPTVRPLRKPCRAETRPHPTPGPRGPCPGIRARPAPGRPGKAFPDVAERRAAGARAGSWGAPREMGTPTPAGGAVLAAGDIRGQLRGNQEWAAGTRGAPSPGAGRPRNSRPHEARKFPP